MAQTGYGSAAKPVSLDHFQRIKEVGWDGGGVVVVEAEYLIGVQFLEINVLAPEDITVLHDSHFGEIIPVDYQNDTDWYAKKVGEPFTVDNNIQWEDELNDIWIWDQYYIGSNYAFSLDPDRDRERDENAVNAANALYGPYDINLLGQQVAHDTVHFGRPLLGDYVEHTHPSGHRVTYARGYTALGTAYVGYHSEFNGDYIGYTIRPSDPRGFPEPPQSLETTQSWYWYHLGHAPPQDVSKVRQAWLIYFKSGRTGIAELRNAPITLPETSPYNIRGYPDGTSFDVHEGKITAKNGVLPLWEIRETIPATFNGTVQKFTAAGVIA